MVTFTYPPALDFMFQLNEHKIAQAKFKAPKKNNLTKEEEKALVKLSNQKSIIINKADKGGAIVVQNTVDYIKQSTKELSDERFYELTPYDKTQDHTELINEELDRLVDSGEICKKISDNLKVYETRTPQIYFLPKIHKGKLPPPGRPICSSNDGPTEKISALLDYFLNPLVRNEGIEASLEACTRHYGIDTKPSAAALGTLLNL